MPTHRAKGEALLVHAVSQGPQRSWAKLRKVALHWLGEQEINEGNVALEPIPPDPLELTGVVVAQESSQALGGSPEVLLVPLTVSHQEISQWSWDPLSSNPWPQTFGGKNLPLL